MSALSPSTELIVFGLKSNTISRFFIPNVHVSHSYTYTTNNDGNIIFLINSFTRISSRSIACRLHAIARSLLASVALALATSMHALLYEQEYGTVPYTK